MFINLNYLTNIKQLILINNFILFINLFILNINGQERAEVDIKVSGACSPIYLSRRGIDLGKYRPLIKFNPNKVQLIPKNPVIPGCVKIKAEGVEIIKPIKNLFAEVEMRIGGSPDPNNPTLPCTKRIDDKVNQCPCAKTEGSCVFCDFCRQLRAQQQQTKILTEKRKLKNNNNNKGERGEEYNPSIIISSTSSSTSLIEEQCKCETMQPGLYDIETEMCTPQLDDTKQYIPNELQNNILEKTPISMFITVYLMDLQTNPNESYLSAFGKAILQRRMAQNTVACFLMGLDVTLGSNNSNGGGEGNIEEEQNNNNKQQQQPTSSSDSSNEE